MRPAATKPGQIKKCARASAYVWRLRSRSAPRAFCIISLPMSLNDPYHALGQPSGDVRGVQMLLR